MQAEDPRRILAAETGEVAGPEASGGNAIGEQQRQKCFRARDAWSDLGQIVIVGPLAQGVPAMVAGHDVEPVLTPEAMGDAAAAGVVERFSDMVRDKAADCDGQVLKQIGDEFMLVFPDPQRAVSFGIGMQQVAAAEPRFPALRIGAQSGPILYREGDYVGANVNLAARVTSAAMRNQFLVTDAVCQAVDLEGVEFDLVGSRSLKGVSEPVDLFEVRAGDERAARTPDPVCGMELDEESAEARLAWQGHHLLFCSEGCLRRFLQDPDRYPLPDHSPRP